MKKVVLFAVTVCFLLMSCVPTFANVVYVKSGDTYWSTANVAVRADTGKIIPLSYALADDYTYAYLKDGGEIAAKNIEPMKFSDVDEYSFTVNEMSARGVINGNGDGTFQPQRELTRAEMAAIFVRMFEIAQSDEKSEFSDVSGDDWFCPYVMALVGRGVFVRDETFSPNDSVTREQLMTMTHRMLSDMGYMKAAEEEKLGYYADKSAVSEFALNAYEDLKANGYMLIEDCDEKNFEDMSDDVYTLNPQKAVTREECAEFLYYLTRDFIRTNAPAIRREDAPAAEIPVLDGSTSTYDITWNIYNAYYLNCENAEGFVAKHSKTSNSYKRLIDGEVEMIFVPDASEEITKYADEKGVKLKFVPVANEALVFFTSKDNKAKDVTTEKLHEIYVNNGIASWKELGGDDVPLVAYCRNNDSGSHAQMEKFILGGDEINRDISLERTSYIMSSILTDVDGFNHENKDKYALGYSLYYYFNTAQMLLGAEDLALLPIDGVEPSDETISNGEYPYTTSYYAVVRDEENARVDEFLKLLEGEFGEELMEVSGFKAAKKN